MKIINAFTSICCSTVVTKEIPSCGGRGNPADFAIPYGGGRKREVLPAKLKSFPMAQNSNREDRDYY